jgi:hypothetical protein
MPAKNAAATVGRAVRSVLRSRAVQFELVIVDHDSSDGTSELIAGFKDKRLCVVRQVGGGLADALNVGLSRCRAPLLARMDADDIMHPDRLAADVAALSDPSLALVACRVKVLPPAPGATASRGLQSYVAWQNACLSPADHAREMWIEQPVCHPATTFRTQLVLDAGGYRQGKGLPEDYDLYLRLHCAGARMQKRTAVHHGWREHAGTAKRWTRDELCAVKIEPLCRRFDLSRRAVVILGAGKEGRRMGRALARAGCPPAAFVDVDPRKIGRVRQGVMVEPASGLLSWRLRGAFAFAAVGTSGARPVVRQTLCQAGFEEGVDFVAVC